MADRYSRACWILALVSGGALADPAFEYVSRDNAGWIISARLTAEERPITVCEKTLYDVLAEERIHVEGWAQVDAIGPLIGVNLQVAYCDDATPECNYTGRRWPGVHKWAAGNVWRSRGEHHKIMTPSADYISAHHQQAVTFKLSVSVYSSQPRGAYAGVDDCAITFERHRP